MHVIFSHQVSRNSEGEITKSVVTLSFVEVLWAKAFTRILRQAQDDIRRAKINLSFRTIVRNLYTCIVRFAYV
jgi:hypothetical protein